MGSGLDLPLQIRYVSRVAGPSRAATGKSQRRRAVGLLAWRRAAGLPLLVTTVLVTTVMMVATAGASGQKILARSAGVPIMLRSATLSVSIPLDTDSWAIQAAADRSQLALDLQGVDFNAPPGMYYEIYLDLPPEVKNPDPNSTNFVGKLTPRAQRKLDPGSGLGTHIPYSIGDVVRALTRSGAWNPDLLTITFVPRGVVVDQGGRHGRISTVRARIAGLLIISAD